MANKSLLRGMASVESSERYQRIRNRTKWRFIETPPEFLPSPTAVHIETPSRSFVSASHAEIAFWLRLKATPGCTSKLNLETHAMHLYIEPNSEAAKLFVSRMIKKLPEAQARKLLPGRK